jgi:hypothetical protein
MWQNHWNSLRKWLDRWFHDRLMGVVLGRLGCSVGWAVHNLVWLILSSMAEKWR